MPKFAMINKVSGVQTVLNIISSDLIFAAQQLKSNGKDPQFGYDFALDMTAMTAVPGIGWTFDPETLIFTAPSNDPTETIRTEISVVHDAFVRSLSEALKGTPSQIAIAAIEATGDVTDKFTPNEASLWTKFINWITGGG